MALEQDRDYSRYVTRYQLIISFLDLGMSTPSLNRASTKSMHWEGLK